MRVSVRSTYLSRRFNIGNDKQAPRQEQEKERERESEQELNLSGGVSIEVVEESELPTDKLK